MRTPILTNGIYTVYRLVAALPAFGCNEASRPASPHRSPLYNVIPRYSRNPLSRDTKHLLRGFTCWSGCPLRAASRFAVRATGLACAKWYFARACTLASIIQPQQSARQFLSAYNPFLQKKEVALIARKRSVPVLEYPLPIHCTPIPVFCQRLSARTAP